MKKKKLSEIPFVSERPVKYPDAETRIELMNKWGVAKDGFTARIQELRERGVLGEDKDWRRVSDGSWRRIPVYWAK